MSGIDHDPKLHYDLSTAVPPQLSDPRSLDDICSQIDTGFQALSEALRRKTWTFTPDAKSTSHSTQRRLQAAEWQYARVNELRRVYDSRSDGRPLGRLEEWFTERLLQLSCVLNELTRVARRHRKSFVDHNATLSSLEVALESLDDAMRTCTLSAELDELIKDGYTVTTFENN